MHWDVAIGQEKVYVVDTGLPHAVVFAPELPDVLEEGRAIRYHQTFAPEGVNVNFVRVERENCLMVRTYERGVEGETGACGTGSCAAAFVAHRLGKCGKSVQVRTRSGAILDIQLG